MVLRWLVLVLAVGAVFPAVAAAVEKGVILDPGSPVQKEYSLPFEAEREALSGLPKSVRHAAAVRAGIAAPGSDTAPGPLFGLGLTAAHGEEALRRVREQLAGLAGSQGTLAAALPSAQGAALLESGRLAAKVPDSGALGGGSALAGAIVLLGGALGGWLMRRLRVV